MIESFLILWAGGVLLASAIPRPRDVTLQWLRLAGILGLTFVGLALFFWTRRDPQLRTNAQLTSLALTGASILAQLALVQTARPRTARIFSIIAFLASVAAAFMLTPPPRRDAVFAVACIFACAGTGAMTGIVLMDMLLGHAYLTASRMTIAPFVRLNRSLAIALAARAVLSIGATMLINARDPHESLWLINGLYILTRWLIGLLVPGVFVHMAHDCIRRRSTQSATGILYVAGVLILIGEMLGLYLLRETGLPF